ncbi:LutC/YkgG family protein [Streptomyces iconiensis]|uniref:LUD domain-containing protein n=1 Tax=Streptomyces iconiensis TaxID=1384038 RepID=A0ABT7A4T9_9ACTN|nr:LUD domain-containing protein [Streptomyces iconiensis]MDJ1136306.1 LUD domain-containing protein [Streptomyces iconiensis]
MNHRDLVLGRVRRALADVPREELPGQTPLARDYLRVHGDRTPEESAALLATHLTDYRAHVHHCGTDELPAVLARLMAQRGSRSAVVPAGVPDAWLPGDIERVRDSPAMTPHDLDAVGSVVTGCAVAIAETGTLVLDASPDQGRRRITLVPDHHICVVRVPVQVVDSVPQALERLDPARPQTWISGPSATSDIELDRVEGVHGPRTLDVVLLAES